MTPHDERFAALAARLVDDAEHFGGAPSEVSRAALRARLAALASPPRRRGRPWWLLAAAAAGVMATLFLCWRAGQGSAVPETPRPGVESLAPVAVMPRAVDRALRPLQAELAGLRQDGVALARGLWGQVPQPVRELFH